MNVSNQQGNFQNQGIFKNQYPQTNAYQPVGYVQSRYQGIPSQQTTGTQTPVISHVGYTSGIQQGVVNHVVPQQQYQQYQQQFGINSYSDNNVYASPVIAHVGYTAGQDVRSTQPNNSNTYQPVISHVGPTAGQSFVNQGQGNYGQQQQTGYGVAGVNHVNTNQFTSSTQAVTPYNPVYQAANVPAQAGPVISKVGGYTANNQQVGVGTFQPTFQSNVNQRF